MKSFFAAIFLFLALLAISPKVSQADTTVTGTVNYVGQAYISGTSFALLYMTPTGGTIRSYTIPSGAASNGMLAMALTALSTGKAVTCQLDNSGNLVVLYVKN